MGTYNNPGTLHSLFSLSFSLPPVQISQVHFSISRSMNWKSRFNFNIGAKESKFRPVVERAEGNSRVGFNGEGEKPSFPIFRSFNDRNGPRDRSLPRR